jgi:uncharacterized protein YecE (DUF72 family)
MGTAYAGGMSNIRIGIGGWTYEPWRGGIFYPQGHPQKRELEYASRAVTAIEVNGTYYSSFKPDTFAKWAAEVPDDFVFAVKASRYAVNRKRLDEGGESIAKFLGQGIVELGSKLGPILWQLANTKKFDHHEIAGFLKLLPASQNGIALRHAVQVRHDSFHVAEFVDLCREAGVAIVYADSADYPAIADVTGDFVYARLENAEARFAAGYAPSKLDEWAEAARVWAKGGVPDGLPTFGAAADKEARDVFVFMINGAKEKAPAAAMALIDRVGG